MMVQMIMYDMMILETKQVICFVFFFLSYCTRLCVLIIYLDLMY